VKEIRLVLTEIDHHLFGIELSQVQKIIKLASSRDIGSGKGLLRDSDDVVPIVDVSPYLEGKSGPEKQDVVVVNSESGPRAFFCGQIIDIVSLPLSRLRPMPSVFKNEGGEGLIWGVALLDDRMVLLMDLRQISFSDSKTVNSNPKRR